MGTSTERSRNTVRSFRAEPRVKLPLAELLIARNRQRPVSQRDWSEAKSLLDAAEKSSPQSVEPLILRAELYIAQDQFAEAQDELERRDRGFPRAS